LTSASKPAVGGTGSSSLSDHVRNIRLEGATIQDGRSNPKVRALPPAEDGPLLPWLLAALAPMPRTRVKLLLKLGRVRVNGAPTTRFDYPLKAGDRVAIGPAGPDPAADPLRQAGIRIVHEDADLIVMDKPAGLLSVAAGGEKVETAFARLNAWLAARRAGRPFVVHRLDRDTSGLLLFARGPGVRDRLQAGWDRVTKTYLAAADGEPRPAEGTVRNFLTEGKDLRVRASDARRPGSKAAVTHYRVVAARGGRALVEVKLDTGRKHQIRVHLAGLGCPVVGDPAYGPATAAAGRLCLHAWRLAFDHPATGRRIELESPPPAALQIG
jgi:23S rRNA pseudouridine1911/1915/1917 synthase